MAANKKAVDVDKQFMSLIKHGQGLLDVFSHEQAIQPKHIQIIAAWMKQALNLIEPALLPENPDLKQLMRIEQGYSNAISILPGDTPSDILNILTALTRAHEYFRIFWQCDFSRIDPGERAGACHASLHETWRFTRDNLLGPLIGKENGQTKRTALLHSYGRMYCWIHSMVKLGNREDGDLAIAEFVLPLAACLRAIFEIFLDVNLLERDVIENGPVKFFSFHKVAKHMVATKSLALDQKYKYLTEEHRANLMPYADTKKSEMDEVVVGLWGVIKNGKNKGKPKRPVHWTDMKVIERVEKIGADCIRYYQHHYYYCNWCIHSGFDESITATEGRALIFSAYVYHLANQLFLNATEVMMDEFAEFLDMDVLQDRLTTVKLRGPQQLWDVAVRATKYKPITDGTS